MLGLTFTDLRWAIDYMRSQITMLREEGGLQGEVAADDWPERHSSIHVVTDNIMQVPVPQEGEEELCWFVQVSDKLIRYIACAGGK